MSNHLELQDTYKDGHDQLATQTGRYNSAYDTFGQIKSALAASENAFQAAKTAAEQNATANPNDAGMAALAADYAHMETSRNALHTLAGNAETALQSVGRATRVSRG